MLVDVRRPPNYLDDVVSLSNKLAKLANKRDAKSGISEIEIKCLRESGLLTLMVPKEYGGIGATWTEALKVIQKIAKADGLVGQLYGYHLNLTVLAHVLGTPQQKEKYYQQTALNNGFWANAINTWDTGLKISLEGENFHLNGVKAVDGVVASADFRVFSAVADSVREPFFFIIPKDRKGIIANNNGGNFEFGKTDKISFTFQDVIIKKSEVLSPLNPSGCPLSSFLGVIAQLTKTYVNLGIAKGALEAAQGNTFGADSITQDPYILGDYSDLWLELKTAIGLADEVADIVQALWEKDLTSTHEEWGNAAIAVFGAEAFATRMGWEISNRLFERKGTPAKNERNLRDLQSFGGISMPWKGVPQNWTLNYFPQQLSPC